jgi:hypothetical protein
MRNVQVSNEIYTNRSLIAGYKIDSYLQTVAYYPIAKTSHIVKFYSTSDSSTSFGSKRSEKNSDGKRGSSDQQRHRFVRMSAGSDTA